MLFRSPPAAFDARGASPAQKTGQPASAQSLAPQQFQALFNSLFKVLFTFPSRYLFAIGPPRVFSLRWDLPPASSCSPKQPDSSTAPRGAAPPGCDGVLTLSDVPSQGTSSRAAAESASAHYNSGSRRDPDFHVGLLPVHSPLLRESAFVSFPPPNDMLKFSG